MGRKMWKAISKVFIAFAIFMSLLLLRSSDWFLNNFGDVEFATVVYQLFSPMKGTGVDIISEYCKNCLCPSLLLSLTFCVAISIYSRMIKSLVVLLDIRVGKKKMHFVTRDGSGIFSKKIILAAVFIILSINIGKQAVMVGVPEYINSISNSSRLYEQEYVDPRNVTLIFSQKKRNLLLIYMESMETTYADKEHGGGKPYNYIPGLTRLAEENVYFSNDNDLGGANTCSDTTWTMAGLLATSAGINYKLPINGNDAGEYRYFLKGIMNPCMR